MSEANISLFLYIASDIIVFSNVEISGGGRGGGEW